jgi:hypothetical protein
MSTEQKVITTRPKRSKSLLTEMDCWLLVLRAVNAKRLVQEKLAEQYLFSLITLQD